MLPPFNLALALAELSLDFAAPLSNAYLVFLLASRQDLHNNLRVQLGTLSLVLSLIALTRLPTELHFLGTGVLYPRALRPLVVAHEIGVMYLRTVIISLTAERVLATVRSKDYEQRHSPRFGVICTLITLLLCCPAGVYISGELNASSIDGDGIIAFKNEFYAVFRVIDVCVRSGSSVVCFVIFVCLLRYNQKCYSFERMPNKHNLVQRYQFAENIRSSRQLLAIGTIIFICNFHFDFVYLRISWDAKAFPVEYSQSFDLVLALALNLIPVSAIAFHPSMARTFRRHFRRFWRLFGLQRSGGEQRMRRKRTETMDSARRQQRNNFDCPLKGDQDEEDLQLETLLASFVWAGGEGKSGGERGRNQENQGGNDGGEDTSSPLGITPKQSHDVSALHSELISTLCAAETTKDTEKIIVKELQKQKTLPETIRGTNINIHQCQPLKKLGPFEAIKREEDKIKGGTQVAQKHHQQQQPKRRRSEETTRTTLKKLLYGWPRPSIVMALAALHENPGSEGDVETPEGSSSLTAEHGTMSGHQNVPVAVCSSFLSQPLSQQKCAAEQKRQSFRGTKNVAGSVGSEPKYVSSVLPKRNLGRALWGALTTDSPAFSGGPSSSISAGSVLRRNTDLDGGEEENCQLLSSVLSTTAISEGSSGGGETIAETSFLFRETLDTGGDNGQGEPQLVSMVTALSTTSTIIKQSVETKNTATMKKEEKKPCSHQPLLRHRSTSASERAPRALLSGRPLIVKKSDEQQVYFGELYKSWRRGYKTVAEAQRRQLKREQATAKKQQPTPKQTPPARGSQCPTPSRVSTAEHELCSLGGSHAKRSK